MSRSQRMVLVVVAFAVAASASVAGRPRPLILFQSLAPGGGDTLYTMRQDGSDVRRLKLNRAARSAPIGRRTESASRSRSRSAARNRFGSPTHTAGTRESCSTAQVHASERTTRRGLRMESRSLSPTRMRTHRPRPGRRRATRSGSSTFSRGTYGSQFDRRSRRWSTSLVGHRTARGSLPSGTGSRRMARRRARGSRSCG